MSLAKINNVLLGFIVGINLYIVAAPFAPLVTFWWQNHHTDTRQQLAARIRRPSSQANHATAHRSNQVIIPSMLLDAPVLEGAVKDTYKILAAGIWRWPGGSTPDKGGNTVLIGHRFTYTNPRGIFYYLNKVKAGDKIGVTWDDKAYTYEVTSVTEVLPDQTAIESPTKEARLTLFTCTPLWNPKHRLVVVANLEHSGT